MAPSVFLFSKKPNCSVKRPLDRKSLILFAIIFDIILYTKLHKEISQKSSRSYVAYFFVINATKVEFMAPKIKPRVLDSSTTHNRSAIINSKHSRNNSIVHPSGPGILDLVDAIITPFLILVKELD